MLSGQLLRSGNLRDFTALGGVGYPVYSAAAQIRTAVAKQLGPEYADFLAVPQFDSKGEAIDWYAAVEGDIVPWSAASETERAFMRQRLQEISGKIEAHARQIQENPRSNDQAVFGKLLALSTRIPDESHIYLINGKPLVTFWGFVPAGADTNKHVLADLPAGTAVPVPPGAAIEPERRGFWRWLLPLLLLLLLLLILLFSLRSCEVLQPYVPLLPQAVQDIVRDPDASPPEAVAPDQVVPGGAINGTIVVPDGAGSVVPGNAVPGEGTMEGGVPADGSAPVPPDANSSEGPNPDTNEPDQTPPSGEEPNPDNAAQDQTPPQPEAPAGEPPADSNAQPDAGNAADTAPIKPLDIPDQASTQGDPSFMQGNWRSKTGLTSKNSKTPVTIDYAFDKSGKGITTLRMPDGVSCSGPSSTSTSNGKMTIQDTGQLTCTNGKSFAGSKVECVKDASNQTKCTGRYPNGQTYDITLGR